MKYRAEVDGLRAVAVIPVLGFHAGFESFSGGFVGVDVFFVISGFLITALIQNDIANGTFSFSRFYERRARRLAPALILVLGVSSVAAVVLLPPSDLARYGASVLSSLFSVSNMFFWSETGYFAAGADLNPLLHTWSLSVEEQFYFLFPALLVLASRFRVPALWLCLALVVGSFALAATLTPHSPSAAFYLLPTRLWEMAVGAVCALLPVVPARKNGLQSIGGAIGLGMILWAILVFDSATPVPGPLMAVPVIGTSLVLVFGRCGTLVGRLLSLRVLVGIGLISYSLYLWHHPVFAFSRMLSVGEMPPAIVILMIGLSALLAVLSWKYVERPFRGPNVPLFPRRWTFLTAIGGTVTILSALAVWTVFTGGFAGRFDPAVLAKLQASDDLTSIRECTAEFSQTQAAPCVLGSSAREAPKIAVLGDSHASQWLPAFTLMAQQRGWRIVLFAKSACPSMAVDIVSPELRRPYRECTAWRQSALAQIQQLKPDLVLLANSSEGYLHHLGAHNLTPEIWQAGSQATVSALLPRAGAVAILVGNPQFRNFDPRLCVARALLLNTVDIDRCAEPRDKALGTYSSAAERAVDGASIIDLSNRYCPGGWCPVYHGGIITMRDSNHLSRPMTEHLAEYLAQSMSTIMNASPTAVTPAPFDQSGSESVHE